MVTWRMLTVAALVLTILGWGSDLAFAQTITRASELMIRILQPEHTKLEEETKRCCEASELCPNGEVGRERTS
jgi:hypothetical protein